MKRLAVCVFSLATIATGYAYQQTRPWPPGLQQVSNDSPVLSPEASMKTMFIAPGYRLELVASEPMIQEPVAIDWDPEGRLWVVEMPGYMEDMPATTERNPTGRVSVLEDLNGDGKMDKKTVFLDKLVLPRAIKVLERGVLVGEPPNLWFACDKDGDLRADTKEVVTNTYGQELANVEHNANSLLWAMDNWIHTSEVDTFLRFKNGKFEVQNTLARGQWGASQDDAGRIYRNTNQAALFVDLVPTIYYARNRNLLRTRGSYESLGGQDLNVTWPVRPTRGVNRGYQDGVLRPDGTLASFTSVSAPTVYRGDRLPAELYGNVFVVEPAANLVSRIIVSDDGTTLRGRKAHERAEFLASTDERFRPVNLSLAPDGTLYVVDMYHGIIQHKGYITEYLRDQILSRKLERPQGHGRIYRIVHETTKRDQARSLAKSSAADLVDLLRHPSGWWRDTAQRILVERGDRSAVAKLQQQAEKAADWRTRLHALWTLDGLDSLEMSTVVRALDDASRDVRASAVRLSERWLAKPEGTLADLLLKRATTDADWAVRRQLAASFGTLPNDSAVKMSGLLSLIERHGDDAVTLDAALSGISGMELPMLQRLLTATAETPQRAAAVTLLAATIVKSAADQPIQTVLGGIAEAKRPAWQRNALLAGTEAGLLITGVPGSGRRGAALAAAAQNTAPGGRGGPGSAPAFPAFPAGTPAGSARGRGVAAMRLQREPAALTSLAAINDQTGKRVQAVLARLTWPGKPAPAGSVQAAPLTADEQKRFDEGKTVYTTLCQACHQPDGRGLEKVAPTLVGSPFAVSTPGIPIRILLNGKEGAFGLMPPLGSVITDGQIAAVLTFVRRSFGNEATAVDAAAVGETRKAVADRTKPWTEAELQKLIAQ
jgi:mono/diheme cytochrome c family protein/glucose/arabinose dehydrogenase